MVFPVQGRVLLGSVWAMPGRHCKLLLAYLLNNCAFSLLCWTTIEEKAGNFWFLVTIKFWVGATPCSCPPPLFPCPKTVRRTK